MPQITNSPGPLFESSDEASRDHTYAQDNSEHSPALPEATANTSQVKNSCDPDKSKECDVTPQLPDTTLMREVTNPVQYEPDTYELPDETTVPMSDNNYVPDATNSSTNKELDKTSSSLLLVKPLPDATTSQLPDITVVQVINVTVCFGISQTSG